MGDGGDDEVTFILSLKHDGVLGIVLSIISSVMLVFYVFGTLVSVVWRFPRLSVAQTRALMSPNRRMILTSFLMTLILVDFMTVHAWRFLGGDGACVPTPDWFMLWATGNFFNVISMVAGWLHAPYSMALVQSSVSSSAYLAMFYLFSCFARNRFCGSMFVAVPCVITGITNVYFIPKTLQIPIDNFRSLPEMVGRTVARITHGAVTGDRDGVSVFLNNNNNSGIPFADSVHEFEEVDLSSSSRDPRKSVEMTTFRGRSPTRRRTRKRTDKGKERDDAPYMAHADNHRPDGNVEDGRFMGRMLTRDAQSMDNNEESFDLSSGSGDGSDTGDDGEYYV